MDPSLAGPGVDALLRMWPRNQLEQEVFFLEDIILLFEELDVNYYESAESVTPLFKRLAKCEQSYSEDVTDLTLYAWTSKKLMLLLKRFPAVTVPIIIPGLGKLVGHKQWIYHLSDPDDHAIVTTPDKLTEAPHHAHQDLLIQKLQQCTRCTHDLMEADREKKLQCLHELMEDLTSGESFAHRCSKTYVYPEIVKMVETNIFHHYPSDIRRFEDIQDHDSSREKSWRHLQLVFSIFIRFMESPMFGAEFVREVLNKKFVFNILSLFSSENSDERAYARNILQMIYIKFEELQPYIIQEITRIFVRVAYEDMPCPGVRDILDFLDVHVVSVFSANFDRIHMHFFLKALFPLHGASSLSLFHDQLTNCITQIIAKSQYGQASDQLIEGLLNIWPKNQPEVDAMFLSEIEKVLEILDLDCIKTVMKYVSDNKAIHEDFPHMLVIERVTYYWNKAYIMSLVDDDENEEVSALDVLTPALDWLSKKRMQKQKKYTDKNKTKLDSSLT